MVMGPLDDSRLSHALRNVFNHSAYRSQVQEDAVECVFRGDNDVLVLFPTGGGKSLVYQLPGFVKEGLCVVISPLISLIEDQVSNLKRKHINAIVVDGTTPVSVRKRIFDEYVKVKKQPYSIVDFFQKPTHPPNPQDQSAHHPVATSIDTKSLKFMYITPEMAATHSMEEFLVELSRLKLLSYLVIDEAHCVSNWGHEFRPSYLNIGELRNKLEGCCCVAVTATATQKVTDDIVSLLSMRNVKRFRMSCFRSNLFYEVKFVELLNDKTQSEDLIDFIEMVTKISAKNTDAISNSGNVTMERDVAGIVYCRTKDVCNEIAFLLCENGFKAESYHSGLSPNTRKSIQQRWISNQILIIVATISFGMGVDKPDVRFVAHWNMANSIEAYCQESGRAGRDGLDSYCRLYYSKDDRDLMMSLARRSNNQSAEKFANKDHSHFDRKIDALINMITYVENPRCRHSFIAKFFNEQIQQCGNTCDYCVSKKYVEKRLEDWDSYHRQANDYSIYQPNSICDDNRKVETNPIEKFLLDRLPFNDFSNNPKNKTSPTTDSNLMSVLNRLLIQLTDQFETPTTKHNTASKSQNINCFQLLASAKTRQFIPSLTLDTRIKSATILKSAFEERFGEMDFFVIPRSVNVKQDKNIKEETPKESWVLMEYLTMRCNKCATSYKSTITKISTSVKTFFKKNVSPKSKKRFNFFSADKNVYNKQVDIGTVPAPSTCPAFSTASELLNEKPPKKTKVFTRRHPPYM